MISDQQILNVRIHLSTSHCQISPNAVTHESLISGIKIINTAVVYKTSLYICRSIRGKNNNSLLLCFFFFFAGNTIFHTRRSYFTQTESTTCSGRASTAEPVSVIQNRNAVIIRNKKKISNA